MAGLAPAALVPLAALVLPVAEVALPAEVASQAGKRQVAALIRPLRVARLGEGLAPAATRRHSGR